jgi:hypothetical protein
MIGPTDKALLYIRHVPANLHTKLKMLAAKTGVTLEEYVINALRKHVTKKQSELESIE